MIRTTRELREYLSTKNISPEQLGKQIKISNMTLRRLLKRADKNRIPERYHAQLDTLSGPQMGEPMQILAAISTANPNDEFGPLLSELEESGKQCRDVKELDQKMKEKLKDSNIRGTLRSHVAKIWKTIRSDSASLQCKAICIGALLYLINPIDLIPDHLPVIGYLDDLAVLSLVVAYLARTRGSLEK